MNGPEQSESRVDALRAAFDGAFAAPPEDRDGQHVDLLAIRVADHAYAVRLQDISGVVARRTIVPVPASAPALLGLLGLRGEIAPVFGLAALLGHDDAGELVGWSLLCGTSEPIALAFSELQGYLRLPRSALRTHAPAGASTYVDELASTELGTRPVVSVARIVTDLRERLEPRVQDKEP